MEAVSFEDYINRLKAQNIIIETGNSKKYGTVTKYRFSVEQRFHRGYSLGSFYTDDNIKKRISRRQDYLKTQKKKAEERKEKRKAAYDAMSHGIPLACRNGKMCRTPDACRRYKRTCTIGTASGIPRIPTSKSYKNYWNRLNRTCITLKNNSGKMSVT